MIVSPLALLAREPAEGPLSDRREVPERELIDLYIKMGDYAKGVQRGVGGVLPGIWNYRREDPEFTHCRDCSMLPDSELADLADSHARISW